MSSPPVVRISVLQTPPSLKIKLLPKPVVQVRALVQIPAQISVVSVTTGDPGTDAAVVNVGTPGNAQLQFTIPRGAQGSQGDTGPQGIQGETGPAGADSTVPGPPGADGVVQSLVAGSNITIDATDPANPIINSTASGSGDVVGPASAVDGTPAVFDGTTGKLIKNITYAAFKTLLSLVKGDVGLGNVDNTSDATKNAAAAALTNKDLTSATNTFPTLNQNTTGSAAKLTTARNIDGQAFDGSANITVIAPGTHAATGKTTPVDADEFAIVDSAASNVLKKLTWANLKSFFATAAQGAKADTALQGAFGFRNRLINPSGQIWQRANSGAAAITDATYAFDRWYGLTQSAGITASQVTNAENTTPYMMRLSQANATAQRFGIAQAIESANIIDARGQDVTLSARVRMSASTTLRYAIIEWTGTADAITKDVVNSWTSTTFTPGNFFNSTTLTVAASGSVALTANTLASISLTGTVSGSMNNVLAFFWTDSTQAQTVTLDIAKVQLETGNAATAIAWRPYQTEMDLCRRYLRKIFEPPLRGVINATGTLAARVAGPVVPSLRVSPTVSVSGNIPVYDGSGTATGSAIQTNYSTTDFLEVDLGPLSATLNTGRPAMTYRDTGAAYFLMDAEL